MLEVNVHTAVYQVTEGICRGVLGTNGKVATGQNNSISVRDAFLMWDALLPKHLELCVPSVCALPYCNIFLVLSWCCKHHLYRNKYKYRNTNK